MMNLTSPASVRQDCRLIGQTLLKLALPRLIVRAIVIVAALIVWYLAARAILDFGRGMKYEFLHTLGEPTMEMVQKINPYLWWVATGIWTLIVFFSVRAWLAASLANGRATPVPTDVLAGLAPQLGEESLGVLRWSWGERDEPFTVGDLRRALTELRHGRVGKIAMVAEQSQILDGASDARGPRDGGPAAAPRREPRAGRYIEPRIGPAD